MPAPVIDKRSFLCEASIAFIFGDEPLALTSSSSSQVCRILYQKRRIMIALRLP